MKNKIFFVIIVIILFCAKGSSAQMTWNQACSFSGTASSYISIPHSSSLDLTDDFIVEAWVNPVNATSPSAQIILQKRAAGNNGYTLYLNSGRVAIRTNSSTRLIGRTVIPNGQWTHVAGMYDSFGGEFKIFINGVQDTTTSIAGAAPVSNSDSVLIGVGSNSPFNGQLDEIRIWNNELNIPFFADYIPHHMRLSLGANTGEYKNLVLSLPFQNTNGTGTLFSLLDLTSNNNHAINRGVSAFDLSNRPSTTISINECLLLGGSGDYVSGPDHVNVSPTSAITVEAWINPLSFNANSNIFSTIVHKGNNSGSVTDYRMAIQKNKFNFHINETNVFQITSSLEFFPLNKWTHVAFSYSGANGFQQFFINGELKWDDTNFVGNIHDNTDSLYIGGTRSLEGFVGFLDEVRITKAVLPYGTISNRIYSSVNESNDPTEVNVAYNFDGNLVSNSDTGPRLSFRGDARFSENSYWHNSPVSPMTNAVSANFPRGFYISNPNFRIPNSGTSGFMNSDSLDITLSETITDINVFVALNHTDEDNLVLSLISPTGTSVALYSTSSLLSHSDNIVTIFNDQASSDLTSNTYVMFAPEIKPLNNLNSALAGSNTSGRWKLRIQDVVAGDTGILYGWGIQFNNQIIRKSVLSLTSLIQGFYNPVTNLLTPDTMRIFIRNNIAPYAIFISSKEVLNDSGKANFVFTNAPDGAPVYIQLKHRNSIETWSKKPNSEFFAILSSVHFAPFTSDLKYNFTSSPGNAFGNNMVQVDTGPNKFAIYSGDVNQDGVIDGTDGGIADNAAFNFQTGYVASDVNGDGIVDGSDNSIIINNASNFVSKIVP